MRRCWWRPKNLPSVRLTPGSIEQLASRFYCPGCKRVFPGARQARLNLLETASAPVSLTGIVGCILVQSEIESALHEELSRGIEHVLGVHVRGRAEKNVIALVDPNLVTVRRSGIARVRPHYSCGHTIYDGSGNEEYLVQSEIGNRKFAISSAGTPIFEEGTQPWESILGASKRSRDRLPVLDQATDGLEEVRETTGNRLPGKIPESILGLDEVRRLDWNSSLLAFGPRTVMPRSAINPLNWCAECGAHLRGPIDVSLSVNELPWNMAKVFGVQGYVISTRMQKLFHKFDISANYGPVRHWPSNQSTELEFVVFPKLSMWDPGARAEQCSACSRSCETGREYCAVRGSFSSPVCATSTGIVCASGALALELYSALSREVMFWKMPIE